MAEAFGVVPPSADGQTSATGEEEDYFEIDDDDEIGVRKRTGRHCRVLAHGRH